MPDRSNEILFSILGYFGILVLVPILAGKDSEFCKFHANQGLLLLIGEVICGILSAMGSFFFLFSIVGSLLGIAIFVFFILGLVSAAKYEMNPLPVIGGIKILK